MESSALDSAIRTNKLSMTWSGRIAQAFVAAAGAVLLLAAALANQNWFDEHFLPVFFLPRDDFVLGEMLARLFVGGLALAALFALPWIGRLVARYRPPQLIVRAASLLLAALLALGTGELLLHMLYPRASEEDPPLQEPLRHHDPVLGWTFVPDRAARAREGGRWISYTFDRNGYRVRTLADRVDPDKPSILFAGESIMEGFGLQWRQSVPAQVGARLKFQPVNMGVNAYANDQIHERLKRELPRFSHPVAAVILFVPGLMFRDFDVDRPHLGPGLVRYPAERQSSLFRLLHHFVPYHSREAMEQVIRLVRQELTASVALAHSRHAAALIVVPHFGPIDPREARLRRQILDQGHLPYVWIELDPAWRLPHDPHPDAHGACVMAKAIAARLGPELGQTGNAIGPCPQ